MHRMEFVMRRRNNGYLVVFTMDEVFDMMEVVGALSPDSVPADYKTLVRKCKAVPNNTLINIRVER